jgi:hypothetical protein
MYDNWAQISLSDKMDVKYYILNFFSNKALTCERQTLKMMMALLARILKLTWFDQP